MADIQGSELVCDDKRIGKVMMVLRRQLNVSQQAMAGQLSVPCQTYQCYEDGTHPVPCHRLSAFLDYLHISPLEFETTLAGIDVLSHADRIEETQVLIDSFAALDFSSRDKVMEMVRQMLQKEFPEIELQGRKKH